MKKIMFFCIPAHGHHNPTFPVVKELVQRGNLVRYYSFDKFRTKVEATGAQYFSCDSFLPEVSKEEELRGNHSITEMTILDLKTTAAMDAFLQEQIQQFQPDVIVSDSVCFWGKLTARKYNIPLVISTTTFAFNNASSRYMKSSFAEIKDLILGSTRVKAELKNLENYGYHEKSVMPLVKNDNFSDTIVFATEKYQPCASTFSKHYCFAGPSVFSDHTIDKKHNRPLVYISLGTVVNDKPDFYKTCIEALSGKDMDVIIACGQYTDAAPLDQLADNITVSTYVDQLSILSRANVFLTHCGMNSVSESLYMGTPMVFFPQTNEQRAVARRAGELGSGIQLKDESAGGIYQAIQTILSDRQYLEHAMICSEDFRNAPGPSGAASFIESAPHVMPEEDKRMLKKAGSKVLLMALFWIIAIALIVFSGTHWNTSITVAIIIACNIFFQFFKKL